MHFIQFVGIIYALSTSLKFSDAFLLHYKQERYNITVPLEEGGTVFCVCGKEQLKEEIPKESVDKIFDGIKNDAFCRENFESETCDLLKECENCTAELRKCKPVPNTAIQFECTLKQLEKSDRFVRKLETKADWELFGLKRERRKVETCRHPKGLMTADVICHTSLDSVLCKQKCLFGHTLKEGIAREVSCVHSENIWKPTGFEECRPYVDCSVTLLYEGEMNCFTGTDNEFMRCNITCAKKNETLKMSQGLYRCQTNGRWSPELPFCVTPGSGNDLVPAPEGNGFPQRNNTSKAVKINDD